MLQWPSESSNLDLIKTRRSDLKRAEHQSESKFLHKNVTDNVKLSLLKTVQQRLNDFKLSLKKKKIT